MQSLCSDGVTALDFRCHCANPLFYRVCDDIDDPDTFSGEVAVVADFMPEDGGRAGVAGSSLFSLSLNSCHGCHRCQEPYKTRGLNSDSLSDGHDGLTAVAGGSCLLGHGVSRAIRGTNGHLKYLLSASSETFHSIANGLEISDGLSEAKTKAETKAFAPLSASTAALPNFRPPAQRGVFHRLLFVLIRGHATGGRFLARRQPTRASINQPEPMRA
jgi:hypothetical protein